MNSTICLVFKCLSIFSSESPSDGHAVEQSIRSPEDVCVYCKLFLSSSHHLPIAPQVGLGLHDHPPPPCWFFTGLVHAFMTAVSPCVQLPFSAGTHGLPVVVHLPYSSYSLLLLSSGMIPEPWEKGMIQIFI